jgi:hypothetical protein
MLVAYDVAAREPTCVAEASGRERSLHFTLRVMQISVPALPL